MTSIVATEIKASILRHRLLDRLTDRTDIIEPEMLSPGLARRLPRFLIAGVDTKGEPGIGGWPVPTGGRYVKLCFSPVFDTIDECVGGIPHRLPLTQADYVAYVETITGLGANEAADLARIYRFDPAELFDLCRPMIDDCPKAWRSLLSNEFVLAKRLWRDLGTPSPRSQFRRPLIDAFRILAEFERASLIMRHLGRVRAILGRPRFLEALESPLPLASWFKSHELVEVCRWIEYVSLSSGALTELFFARDRDQVLALPPGYAPWAIARGDMIGSASEFHDHPEVRKALVSIFTKPPLDVRVKTDDGREEIRKIVERRTGILRNNEIIRWYGMTNEVLPIIALDDARHQFPTPQLRKVPGARPHKKVGDDFRIVLARLGAAMRRHADPAMHDKIEAASDKYLSGSKLGENHENSLEANTRLGLKQALTYLPAFGRPGAAARFDPLIWENPMRDADLWRMMLDVREGGRMHNLSHPVQHELRRAIELFRRVYGPFIDRLQWSPDVERTICDIACALGPISADPHIAFAIYALSKNPSLQMQLGFSKRRNGHRR